jgi:peptidoglycan/LPS O-acetylase OafA/YrhL
VEEQFYLVAPLLIRLLSGRSLKAFLLAVIAGAPLLRAYLRFDTAINRTLITAMMPCRADSLAVGILAAVLWRSPIARQSCPWAALLLLVPLILAFSLTLRSWLTLLSAHPSAGSGEPGSSVSVA